MQGKTIGFLLAVLSSAFIGSSFIVKKRGLRLAGASGLRAGAGGYSYLVEPMWWLGFLTMVIGEGANFAAYAFAPAIVVTPLGALSILVSAILADRLLNERLNGIGWLGCGLCVVGAITIVLNAPEEQAVSGVRELWVMASQPQFLAYAALAVTSACFLATVVAPTHGSSNLLVHISVCSLVGSLSVLSCKALGISIKLSFMGSNQLIYPETWFCAAVVIACVVTQMNYLNKARAANFSQGSFPAPCLT